MNIEPLEILYADNHLLAVNKPAGVLSQGDRSGDPSLLETARAWIKDRYRKPGNVYLGLVHRLDRPVAGVMLFARTSKAAGRLSAAFREGRVQKSYHAVVAGVPQPACGTLDHWLLKSARQRRSRVVAADTPGARRAVLDYEVRASTETAALMTVRLHTGRSHQVRVQLAEIGHPILGDRKYGAAAPLADESIALFACRLTVPHPTRDDTVRIEAPAPPGWPWPPTEACKPGAAVKR